ncbi:MAG: hypothetical protein R3F49_21850 [Planctomycetota bacterium]
MDRQQEPDGALGSRAVGGAAERCVSDAAVGVEPGPSVRTPWAPSRQGGGLAGRLALVGALCLLGVALVWTAWLGDDAFITFRAMDNFVHGRGLGWNVGERVQAFTNPLWLFLLALPYALTGELYWVAIAAGFLCTGVVVALIVRRASSAGMAAFGVLLLAGSKAFVDYGTSGLENPLLHIFVLLAVGAFLAPMDPARRAVRVAWATSFAFLTRPDALVLTSVLCVAAWLGSPTLGTLRRMCFAWLPAFAWETFSLVYFGTFVPNTAIAKLAGELPRNELVQQGLFYLRNSLHWDPLTLTTVAVAVLALALRPSRWRRRECVVALAVVLHLVYLLRVGGDFMSGRFLTSPFVVAVALIVRWRPERRQLVAGSLVVVALSVWSERSTWRPRPGPLAFLEALESTGITNERAFYYAFTGLVSEGHPTWGRLADGALYPPAEYARMKLAEGERVQVHGQIGMYGCLLGPEVHVVDPMGLADPLLARLPLTTHAGDSLFGRKRDAHGRFWKVGHLHRDLPPGYLASLESDSNQIEHPALARYYGALRALTRAPIWSRERWRVLFAFHTGRYDADLDAWRRDRTAELERGKVPRSD